MAQDVDRYERDLALELLEAVRTGNTRGVAALLIAGASVDGSPLAGVRPLLLAAASGDARMMHALIEVGADVNAGAFGITKANGGGGGGNNPPGARGKVSLVEGTRPMHLAVKNGDKAALRLLLCADANPSLANRDGFTPLMSACMVWNGVAMARELLRAGADPYLTDRYGATAVHYAAREAHKDLVSVLLSKGAAALNWLDYGGRTPLYVAADSGRTVAVRRLLSMGARQPRTSGSTGRVRVRCPLQAAVRRNHRDVARILVERGKEAIGGGASAMLRAMKTAAETGRAKILHILLEAQEGEGTGRRGMGFGVPPQRARSSST
eukprot:g10967.t1